MAKGNTKNLIQNRQTTPEERRENARKAGIASGIARKKKKDFREACLALLESDMQDDAGNTVTGYDVIVSSMFYQAKMGNVKAFETLRDTAGQKPVDKVVVADVDQSVIDEVEDIVNNVYSLNVDNTDDADNGDDSDE